LTGITGVKFEIFGASGSTMKRTRPGVLAATFGFTEGSEAGGSFFAVGGRAATAGDLNNGIALIDSERAPEIPCSFKCASSGS
jgi:hypothetical protein